jgi:hypothetical protein
VANSQAARDDIVGTFMSGVHCVRRLVVAGVLPTMAGPVPIPSTTYDSYVNLASSTPGGNNFAWNMPVPDLTNSEKRSTAVAYRNLAGQEGFQPDYMWVQSLGQAGDPGRFSAINAMYYSTLCKQVDWGTPVTLPTLPSFLNGPGAYNTLRMFAYSYTSTTSSETTESYDYLLWTVPDSINIVNMTSQSTVWVAGEVLQPGAFATVWRPPMTPDSFGKPSILGTNLFVSVNTCAPTQTTPQAPLQSTGKWSLPSTLPPPWWQVTNEVCGPSTLANSEEVGAMLAPQGTQQVAGAAILQVNEPVLSAYVEGVTKCTSTDCTTLFPTPQSSLYNLNSAEPANFMPATYALMDTKAGVSGSWPTYPAGSALASVWNATPGQVDALFPVSDSQQVQAIIQPSEPIVAGAPGGVMSLPVPVTGTSPPVFSFFTTTATPDKVDVTVNLAQFTNQVPMTFVSCDTAAFANTVDWTQSGSLPTPQIQWSQAGTFFAAVTCWARAGTSTVCNINIVLRTAPLIRLVSRGLPLDATGTVPSTPPAMGFAYLGSMSSSSTGSSQNTPDAETVPPYGGYGKAVQIVANGPSSTLTPASMQDVVVLSLPAAPNPLCITQPSVTGNTFAPTMIYDTLSLAALQLARPATPSGALYNYLPAPVPLTEFTALLADNGAEVLIAVGNSMFAKDVIPVGCAGAPNVDASIPYALPISGLCPNAAQFVSTVCAAPGFTDCRDVGGITQSSCLGYFSNTLLPENSGLAGTITQACSAICEKSQDPDTGAACRQIIETQCGGASGDTKPECVCANILTSTVKTNIIAGSSSSLRDFTSWFQTNFKGGSIPQLIQDLQCWWPACQGPGAGLVAYQVCPTVIENCFALVSDVQVSQDSRLKIKLKNACGLEQQDTPSTRGQTITPPPTGATAARMQLPYIIAAAAVALFLCMGILLGCGAASKSFASRRSKAA